jgi:DNA-3-methyladenine glycosylase II
MVPRAALSTSPVRRLDLKTLELGVQELVGADPDLAAVVVQHGPPPLWGRRPGFATLIRIVLEQQVSLASAHAVFRRLQHYVGPLTAERIVGLGTKGLRQVGFTRQKAGYCYDIAVDIVTGCLDLSEISGDDDEQARARLLAIRGIGPWTADIYRLMALRRPDIWPDGDLALAESARVVKRLRTRPSVERLAKIARM